MMDWVMNNQWLANSTSYERAATSQVCKQVIQSLADALSLSQLSKRLNRITRSACWHGSSSVLGSNIHQRSPPQKARDSLPGAAPPPTLCPTRTDNWSSRSMDVRGITQSSVKWLCGAMGARGKLHKTRPDNQVCRQHSRRSYLPLGPQPPSKNWLLKPEDVKYSKGPCARTLPLPRPPTAGWSGEWLASLQTCEVKVHCSQVWTAVHAPLCSPTRITAVGTCCRRWETLMRGWVTLMRGWVEVDFLLTQTEDVL